MNETSSSMNREDTKQADHSDSRNTDHRLLGILVFISISVVCYVAKAILIPTVAAFFLYLLFNPSVRRLKKKGCPRAVSSTIITLIISLIFIYSLSSLVVSLREWTDNAPETMERVKESLMSIRQPMEEAAEAIENATESDNSPVTQVEVKNKPQWTGVLFTTSVDVLMKSITCLGLTFFLLLSGEELLKNLSTHHRNWSEGKKFYDIFKKMEIEVSRYLVIRTFINIGLTLVVWGLLVWFELPNALTLAITIGLLNYIPYLGPLVGFFVIGAATLVLSGPEAALKLGALYFIIQTIEGMILTPWMMGDMLKLNPIVVFLAILIWGWIWGVAGALMAVPILSVIYIISENTKKMERFSLIIGPTQQPTGKHNSTSNEKEIYGY